MAILPSEEPTHSLLCHLFPLLPPNFLLATAAMLQQALLFQEIAQLPTQVQLPASKSTEQHLELLRLKTLERQEQISDCLTETLPLAGLILSAYCRLFLSLLLTSSLEMVRTSQRP